MQIRRDAAVRNRVACLLHKVHTAAPEDEAAGVVTAGNRKDRSAPKVHMRHGRRAADGRGSGTRTVEVVVS